MKRALVPLLLFSVALLSACANKVGAPAEYQPVRQLPPQPQDVSPKTRAQLHTDLATGYYERGQMDVALQELGEAVVLDPTYAQAYNVYGLVYTVLRDDVKAQQNFERALSLAPNDPEIHHNWGWYLCAHKRERDALAQFDLAIRDPLYRTPEIALVNAGRCAQELGEARMAEQYFRRALSSQPGNALASYGLAVIAYKEKRYPEARAYMRAVMQTNSPAPESLYLGMCVERKLGDRQAELSYVSQLRNRYPKSVETEAINADRCE